MSFRIKPQTPAKRTKQPRQKALSHLKWIASLPSVISGQRPCQACHLRFQDPRFAKRYVGMSEKPDDAFVLPMTPEEHTAQHATNEREWWGSHGIDATLVALALYHVSGDDDAAAIILTHARNWR